MNGLSTRVFFDKLPSTGSGRSRTGGTIGLESGAWKPKEIKNGLRTLFLYFVLFFAIHGERVKNLPELSLVVNFNNAYPRSY
ncbi:MAG: hypothetical protein LBD67_08480 [Candidatus Accumulibacter sp.]|jgi:hypothetical protein|nr:hypothetical protein [Accumulibacter sp.]